MREMSKAERKAARERLNAYYLRKQQELLAPVIEAIDRYRRGEIDAWEMDYIIHVYHRQSQELYSFAGDVSGGQLGMMIYIIEREEENPEENSWRPKAQYRKPEAR